MHTEENYLELLKYSCILNGHLNWESRQNYLNLLKDFTKGKIKYFEFCIDFETRGKLTSEATKMLESNSILLSPHEKSFGFSNLLEEIFDLCDTQLEQAQEFHGSEIEFQSLEIQFRDSIEIEGYHLYNDKTGFDAFFDKNGRRYRTGMKVNRKQKIDIKIHGNIM